MSEATEEYLPRPGEFDPLAEEDAPEAAETPRADAGTATPSADAPSDNGEPPRPKGEKKPREKLIEFFSPSQLKAYEPPANQSLVGDYHLQRGVPAVLAGPPGCGKSRAALWLAILGARGAGNWFGMEVHCQFRTLILQNENGLTRLHRDMRELPGVEGLDDWLRISAPPVYGLALQNPLIGSMPTTLGQNVVLVVVGRPRRKKLSTPPLSALLF